MRNDPKLLLALLLAAPLALLPACTKSEPEATDTSTAADDPAEGTSKEPAPAAAPEEIWTPAARGDTAAVKAGLEAGLPIDALDPTFGATALTFAADFGHAETVTALIEAGADIDARNRDGSTPILGAAFFGRPECVRVLLEAGADATLANGDGTTPLTALDVPPAITKMIADALQMPLDADELAEGREACREILAGDG